MKTLHNIFLCSDSFPVLWASQPYPSSTQGKYIYFQQLIKVKEKYSHLINNFYIVNVSKFSSCLSRIIILYFPEL
jgi:hypothetical protein